MSEAKHTPGPWALDHGDDVERGHVGISSKSHSLLAQVVWKFEDDDRSPRCEANAHLIAAAPDLLAALKNLLARFESEIQSEYSGTSQLAERLAEADPARAAIAKAEGGAA